MQRTAVHWKVVSESAYYQRPIMMTQADSLTPSRSDSKQPKACHGLFQWQPEPSISVSTTLHHDTVTAMVETADTEDPSRVPSPQVTNGDSDYAETTATLLHGS